MDSVRVRMFRQGLGDSFLLTFPGDAGEVHVLIDLGVLLGTPDAAARMQKMASHIVETTKGKLDVMVATHEHWDHVSGFAQAEPLLGKDKLDVGQVWVAWTEKPGEPLADELRGRRAAAVNRIAAASRQLGAVQEPAAQKTAGRLNAVLEFWGGLGATGLGAAGRATTTTAMNWVKSRTAPREPEYLYPGAVFALPGAQHVRVYVLGPPHDKKMIKKSDPTKGASEVYQLAAASGADFGLFAAIDALDAGEDTPEAQPFDEWFRISESEAGDNAFFRDHYQAKADDWRRIEHDWLGPAGTLALQLDSDTNNTSLVLAFELVDSGQVLLFPADAQVGNWLSWETVVWTVEENGKSRKVTSADLLARTVFYKIGHHGSHNATLREKGLELMTNGSLVAMLPLDRKTAKKMEWNMPFPSLYDRLNERCKGRILDLELGMPAKPDSMSPEEWKLFQARVEVNDDWIDYKLPL